MSCSRVGHPSSSFLVSWDKGWRSLLIGVKRMRTTEAPHILDQAAWRQGWSWDREIKALLLLDATCPSGLSGRMLAEAMRIFYAADLARFCTERPEVPSSAMLTDSSSCPVRTLSVLDPQDLIQGNDAAGNSLETSQQASRYLWATPLSLFC